MEYKEGYYWVKVDDEWVPGEYDGDMWYIILVRWALKTDELQEIGERLVHKDSQPEQSNEINNGNKIK
jgi:hypothetical protein